MLLKLHFVPVYQYCFAFFRPDSVAAEVLGPSGPVHFDFDFVPSAGGGKAIFRTDEVMN